MSLEEPVGCEDSCQAFATIRDHPQLSHVKRIRIKFRTGMRASNLLLQVADEVGSLFQSTGPLDELIIYGCDLPIFLVPLLDLPERGNARELVPFPPIDTLTILDLSIQIYYGIAWRLLGDLSSHSASWGSHSSVLELV